MIISNKQVQSIIKAYGVSDTRRKLPGDNRTAVSRNDSLEISREAKELSTIRRIIDKTPDIRLEKVTAIKKAIANGTYHVDSRDIAHKMIVRSLVDRIVAGEQDGE
ncbi:MAG: flagellar biosynthesis anti-sigma factor FlgM [Firmicutes bacterium]|jgi:flagellar biosynthesis anti-sigma factor FlgM|nr:flagellar biosynthesis anti-sigma factor FlgM [Bacillota bacterium]